MSDEAFHRLFYEQPSSDSPEYYRNEKFKELLAWIINELGRHGATRETIYKQYIVDYPTGYSYSRFCRKLKEYRTINEATIRIEHKAGYRMMVDFAGSKAQWVDVRTGEVHQCEVLVTTLPFSSFTHVYAVSSQKQSDFVIGITGRDVRGIEKTLSGLLKLLYPHGELSDVQLGELLELALECRQRVRNQLHLMAPGEYGPIKLGAKMVSSGKEIVPTLPDAYREQKVSLPSFPRVGEITGLAVIGDDRGCLRHFEVQASKGSGRIVSLGSMQRVMKESVAAAAQFVKVHPKALGLPTDWQDNQDVAVLATISASRPATRA